MEEVIVGEVAKGLFRAAGYLIIELFLDSLLLGRLAYLQSGHVWRIPKTK